MRWPPTCSRSTAWKSFSFVGFSMLLLVAAVVQSVQEDNTKNNVQCFFFCVTSRGLCKFRRGGGPRSPAQVMFSRQAGSGRGRARVGELWVYVVDITFTLVVRCKANVCLLESDLNSHWLEINKIKLYHWSGCCCYLTGITVVLTGCLTDCRWKKKFNLLIFSLEGTRRFPRAGEKVLRER